MKIIRLVLVVLMLAPFASFAEDRAPNQTDLILSSENFRGFDDLLVDCAWAIPFIPAEVVGGWTSSLHALQVHIGNGKVLKNGALVGSMWTCLGAPSEGLNPLGPTFEQPIAFAIFIGDQTLGALGTALGLTGNESASAPFSLVGIRATVVRVVDGVPGETLGSLTSNVRCCNSTGPGRNNELVTLRLFEPLPNFSQ
ncbi:MAG: hypothetical protein V7754_21845 [Halioglobus sp.]